MANITKFSSNEFISSIREFANGSMDTVDVVEQLNEPKLLKAFLECSTDLEQKQIISSLGRLLDNLGTHDSLAWKVIDGLEYLFNFQMSESMLLQVQKLTPQVAHLATNVTSEDHKLVLLRLLQKLTYRIKLPRPDSFISPLIASLVRWSKAESATAVIQLSLSVLANLLHQNKSVQSILIQTVGLKQFMNGLLLLKDNLLLKMEVCKLMFLLENLTCEKPDEAELLSCVKVTICTITETSCQGDQTQLEQCILFFEEMVDCRKITTAMLDKPCFLDSIKNVMPLLETDSKNNNPDVAMLLFRFLRILVEMKLSVFYPLYGSVMQQGVAWVSMHKKKSGEAINTMCSLMASEPGNTFGLTANDIIKTFLPLLTEAESNNDCVFLTMLLRFLRQSLDVKAFSLIKNGLQKETMKRFIEALPGDNSFWINFTLHEPAVKMYIHLFSFVFKYVTSCDGSWMEFYTQMLREQKVISVLAVALTCGSADLKGMVLALIGGVAFPQESLPLLSKAMEDCGERRPLQNKSCFCELSPSSVSNNFEVQKFLKMMKNSLKGDESYSTKILQVHEYKDQMQLEYQRSLISSLSNASREIAGLREMDYVKDQLISEIRQELYCFRLTFENMRQKYESSLKANEEMSGRCRVLQTRLEQETVASQKAIKKLEESISKLESEGLNISKANKYLKVELVEKAHQIDDLTVQKEDLLKSLDAMQEKTSEQRAEQEATMTRNAELSEELARVKGELENNTKLLFQKEEELTEKTKKIEELQRLRDIVCELTSGDRKSVV